MKMLKKILSALYIIIIVCMGGATIVEKYRGTEYVSTHVYGSWWFTAVWALLAAAAVFYFIRMRVRRPSAVALHLSFAVILAGALLTHLFSERGMIHLRQGVAVDKYVIDAGRHGTEERTLPFKLRLDKFRVVYHEGTEAVSDYESRFTVIDEGRVSLAAVSMNNIFSYRSIRFYQANYDEDGLGSVLSMNSDPLGIPVTYTGYGLLFLSLLWMLADPKGAYRRLLRSDAVRKGMLTVCLLMCLSSARAVSVLPKDVAAQFGQLNVLYNDRICPLQTFAIDFTKKLCGSRSYNGYTAEQVLTGFIFYGDEWSAEPVIRLKNGALRETLQLPKHVSVNSFFNQDMGGYTIGPYVREYYQGSRDEFHTQVADIDDRLQLVMNLRHGLLLKVFPYTVKGRTTWYAPNDNITDKAVDADHRNYIKNVFTLIYQEIQAGDYAHVSSIIDKMRKYQQANAGQSLPTETQLKAERTYNAVPFATVLFMVNLTMGLLTLLLTIRRLVNSGKDSSHRPGSSKGKDLVGALSAAVLTLSFLALTLCLALRWIISGTVPMSNGYETMLLMAWLIMLCSLLLCRRFRIILTFGFLMSGFFLLVSHISQMDPQITHIMPVLNSPLLSVHVSVIMMAFALLSLTFICGLTAVLLCIIRGRRAAGLTEQMESLRVLSDLFLYPALAALGFGIFIGAVWANVSWGTYWSWDAKETWGLITFMIYAVSVHRVSVPFLRRPMGYHVFMVLAFLSILMTYFGVNYFLGGMHSYA